jgi:hypothetical protein
MGLAKRFFQSTINDLPIFIEVTTKPNMNVRAVIWSEDLEIFCAVGENNGAGINCAVSSDGITWTTGDIGQNNNWASICYSKFLSLFVATSITGTNRVATSSDGINWTLRTASTNTDWVKVISAEFLGLLIAVRTTTATSTLRIMTSSDGINWTSGNLPTAFASTDIDVGEVDNIIVIVGIGGVIYSSSDAINWDIRTNVGDNANRTLFYASITGIWLSNKTSGGAADRSMFSTDGINWSTLNVSGGSNYFGEHIKTNFYVALPFNGNTISKRRFNKLSIPSWSLHQTLASNGSTFRNCISYSPKLSKMILLTVTEMYLG